MNIVQNILPATPATTGTPAVKSAKGKSKTEQGKSFSDSLDREVSSQSDTRRATAREQTTSAKKNGTAQAGSDSSEVLTDEIAKGDSNAPSQPTVDVLAASSNAVLAAQMFATLPTTNMTQTLNIQSVEQTGASLDADQGQSGANFNLTQTLNIQSGEQTKASLDADQGQPGAISSLNQSGQWTSILGVAMELPATGLPTNNQIGQSLATNVPMPEPNQSQFRLPAELIAADITAKLGAKNLTHSGETDKTKQPLEFAENLFPKLSLEAETIVKMPGAAVAQPSQQSVDQVSLITVNQHNKGFGSNLADGGQADNLAERGLFSQSDIRQDSVDNTDNVQDVFASRVFAQGLTPKTDNVSVALPVEAQKPATPAPDVHQIFDQIVEQVKMNAKSQSTEMIIKLKPEHLGELTLKVAVDNGVVKASFHSNNNEVRSIIEASLPQLKQDLANSGLKVENVSVYAGLSQFLPNHNQDRSSQQPVVKFANKKSADDFVEAIEGIVEQDKVSSNGSQTGVDYRI